MIYSQCCAGCNPVGGNTNLGTLPKYMLQINSFYRYGFSRGYMENDHPSNFKFIKDGYSDYAGLQLAYGVTKKFTADLESGYYINRTQNIQAYGLNYLLNGYGLSSVTLGGRYNIYRNEDKEFEFTSGIGVRIPSTTVPMVVDGVELSQDVQPCNGAYGVVIKNFFFKEYDSAGVRLFLASTININSTNPKQYKEGASYLTSVFVSKTLRKKLTGILQLRNEIRQHCYQYNAIIPSSGGIRFVLVPQLNFSIKQKYNISALYELPLYQYYNGIQLRDVYAFSINLNIRLGLSKKAEVCAKP
jgi:hypothetical protein